MSMRDVPVFHWEQPGWDDRAVEQAIEATVAEGKATYPSWTWKPLPPYNGCTGAERVEGWKKVWLACRLGWLPWPKVCSICLTTAGRLQYHNEDYRRPLQAKPVCVGCHRMIHNRFRDPFNWRKFVQFHSRGRPTPWFADLIMTEVPPPPIREAVLPPVSSEAAEAPAAVQPVATLAPAARGRGPIRPVRLGRMPPPVEPPQNELDISASLDRPLRARR